MHMQARLVVFDDMGRETEGTRDLNGEREIVELHYDYNPEAGNVVFDVEMPPGDPFALRVNLNDGVSILFDSADDAGWWLTQVKDAINVAVEQHKHTGAREVAIPFVPLAVCSWCGRVLKTQGVIPPAIAKPVSHGICPDCASKHAVAP